jgi:peptidoglycan/xylan/chitin deacetylase (PgdA/CDA1 family)
MPSDHVLRVVMYHYVRDPARTAFPALNAMLLEDFRQQVSELAAHFEMASVESSLDFLTGEYRPRRDLCLLTFDDGLREHYQDVVPWLVEKKIRGAFFIITSCIEEKRVAPVHMNHFLMASMKFEDYADCFFRKAVSFCPDAFTPVDVDTARAAETYPWDTPEVARFKYLFNFGMDPDLRDRTVRDLFSTHIGPEQEFAESLYFNWEEARRMQKAGMALGGHTHQHKPLANLSSRELAWDLSTCQRLMSRNLMPQGVWPFSYPYGKRDSFHIRAMRKLQELNFHCAFSTETADNRRGADVFTIGRTDCKKALSFEARA